MREPTDHCVLKDGGEKLQCMNCGLSYTINMPIPLPMFVALVYAFIELHRLCKPPVGNAP